MCDHRESKRSLAGSSSAKVSTKTLSNGTSSFAVSKLPKTVSNSVFGVSRNRSRRKGDGACRALTGVANLRALRLLRPGGMLITCSCSYHVGEDLFMQMLAEAAADAGRAAQIVEKRAQSRDHPISLTVPETHYLKCVILRVL